MKNILTICSMFIICSCYCQTSEPIIVTAQNINITGTLEVASWVQEHPNKPYPNYPKMYYGFAQGDEIIIDFVTENKKGTQAVEISEWESKSVVYSNRQFQTLDGIRIKVPKTAVYKFEFGTNFVFDRQAKVTIKRIPAADSTKNFNCNITWKVINDTTFTMVEEKRKVASKYQAVNLQTPIDQFINGGVNATLMGGKSRITTQIILPPNTVEWYYTFAATRDKTTVENTKHGMKLFIELAGLLDRTGLTSLSINALTQPPAADYCDVYLLKPEDQAAFINKGTYNYIPEGTRENLKSGIVKINHGYGNILYLGLKNPANSTGVSVMYEIVAIVETPTFETAQIKKPVSVTRKNIPVFGN